MTTIQSPMCVFYDGACPLCQREVKRYKKLYVPNGNEEIDWIDISKSKKELRDECIHYDDAMRLIHIKDGSGIHQVGLEGVLTLWDKIPYYRVASKFIRQLTFLRPLFAKAYEFLAKYRMVFTGRRK